MSRPSSAPDLAALLADPTREVPHNQIPPLLSQLAALQAVLAARLLASTDETATEPTNPEQLLTVDQASSRLGISPDWLYRRSTRLPFVVRVGRHLRFSSRGIDRYIQTRQGR
jgi:excisionase family DNA binding protein